MRFREFSTAARKPARHIERSHRVAQLLQAEPTSFTLDTMGRDLCNTAQEAIDSAAEAIAGVQRDFDVIIVGGGSFGSEMAARLLSQDQTHSRRILVLEAGPFVLPEHVQNLPFAGGLPNFRRPWVYDPQLEPFYQFQGLLYAIGGRSLAWGGWAPQPLHNPNDDEMVNWPPTVINDLRGGQYLEASDALGVTDTNDFIFGPLHQTLRSQLFAGLNAAGAPAGLILNKLEDHPLVQRYFRDHPGANPAVEPTVAQLKDWLKLPCTDTTPRTELLKMLRLEAPLAVQASTDPGFFPFNKFSAIPPLIEAARIASSEADGVGAVADARKRLLVAPDFHVQELITETQPDNWVRVVGVRGVDRTGATVEFRLTPPRADGSQGVVILGAGTIETTRVALWTFKDSLAGRAAQRMGENLMAHLRSNLTIRIPDASIPQLNAAVAQWKNMNPGRGNPLEVSALFVKGKAKLNGVDRYFHVQISASGLSNMGTDAEARLFKKVPDIDHVDELTRADETSVVVVLRGIGQMAPMNPDSRVGLAQTPGDVDFSRPAAYVNIGNALAPAGGSTQTQSDRAFWDAIDDFIDQLALIFANGQRFEILTNRLGTVIPVAAGTTAAQLKALRQQDNARLQSDRRDALGTTHHEAGTMRMSINPGDGVTNEFGRIHDTTNCYVVGPALLPTMGSPNPMLTGVAMARRTADLVTKQVLPRPPKVQVAAPWQVLFDGTTATFNKWVHVSPGNSNGFALIDGNIVTYGTSDFGLLYYAAKAFADFTLQVQFRVFDLQNQNSGIFVRFRDPSLNLLPVTLARMNSDSISEKTRRPDLSSDIELFQRNRAWSAVHSGFEVQIDDNARGDPRKDYYGFSEDQFDTSGGLHKNRTGAIYKIPAGDPIPNSALLDAQLQTYTTPPKLVPGNWYEFTIDVRGNKYTVDLMDLATQHTTRTTIFQNTDPDRGVGSDAQGNPLGFIGLQSYPSSPLAFGRIQIRP
jgi:choline dehydrogenase-like flavoprotein